MDSAKQELKKSLVIMGTLMREGPSGDQDPKQDLLAAARAVKSARAIAKHLQRLSERSP